MQDAIEAYNRDNPEQAKLLSSRNPANFFKDLIRKQSAANSNWPRYVWECGYTGVQLTAAGNCFQFVPVPEGQTVPFPRDVIPLPDADTPRIEIESVSLPLASRRLGRGDEPWLIQVLVKLRVLETHLALYSSQAIIQLDHLQTNVKLAGSEIDAIFLAVQHFPTQERREVIVICEAKGRHDDILPTQILAEVHAVYGMGIDQDTVIPMAAKAIAPSEVWIVEFEPVHRDHLASTNVLSQATTAVYVLTPPVPGIGR